jgi:hypothetical protein
MTVAKTTWYNLLGQVDLILANQRAILAQGVKIMATVDDIQADVTAEDTVIDSAVVLLKGLADALKAAGTDPTKLAALHTDITTKTQALAAAVAVNTPSP